MTIMNEQCKECQYCKDKEDGSGETYCSLNECMFSDFQDMPYQFDNMTGSMNL